MNDEIIIALGKTIFTSIFIAICACISLFAKKLLSKINKKNQSKHLNKILKNGFSKYGKEEVNKLFIIATENEEEAIKWMSENKSERDALHRKIMYYELTASEKDVMQEKYDRLNELHDIVFYIRYYRRKGYDVQTALEKLQNKIV